MLRFFGGWDYAPDSVHSPYFETIGYRDGVPMGGELTPESDGAPTFMVQAMKDPDAANLDQVQIIKGWIDEQGETHEQIFYVALSDNRSVDPGTGLPEPALEAPYQGRHCGYPRAPHRKSARGSRLVRRSSP